MLLTAVIAVDDDAAGNAVVIEAGFTGAIACTPPGGVHPVRRFVETAATFVGATTLSTNFSCTRAGLLDDITTAPGFSAAICEIARGFANGITFGGGVSIILGLPDSEGID